MRLPHADLVPRALGICGAPAVSTLRVITGVYFIGCSVCSTPAKRVILTLPHALHRKYAPLKALACKKALYVNKALKNSLYSHKEPFCVGDERGKQGRGSGGKTVGGRAYFSTGNGYNRVPCPHPACSADRYYLSHAAPETGALHRPRNASS